jgi:hypothetical protein
MKRVRFLLVMLALLTVSTAQAQNTPEALIRQCPDLPSVDYLMVTNVQYAMSLHGQPFKEKVEKAHETIQKFLDDIDTLKQKGEAALAPIKAAVEAGAKKDADRIAKQVTGRSTEQLENMSDKELEAMANSMVSQRISAAGLGNMSIADLQALEGKSDKEIMKAMENAKPVQAGAAPKATAAQNKDKEAIERMEEELRRIRALNGMTLSGVREQMKEIYNKYYKELDKRGKRASEMFEGYMDHLQYTHDQYAVAQREYEDVQEQYLTECFTAWLVAVAYMQERALDIILAMIPEVKNPPKNAAGMVAYDFAGLYFEITQMATTPPLFEGYNNLEDVEL